MIKEAVNMVSAIEGLSYSELMNLPTDEFIEVRNNVVRISNKRNSETKSMGSGRRR